MVVIKTEEQIQKMAEAAKILTGCHRMLRTKIQPGITTLEIDRLADEFITSHGATPEQKGYKGFPYATCASVNDEICHGFPSHRKLEEGDIVTIDMVVNLNGWLADSAWSYAVGQISPEAERLLKVTKECLYLGIEQAVVGNRIGDVSYTVQKHAEGEGYSVVREFTGHGIGSTMHEELWVPHYGIPHRGVRIRAGMVFTIEPMINIGTHRLKIDDNGWTARTLDGTLSAQYEHTIAITENGPLILTEQD